MSAIGSVIDMAWWPSSPWFPPAAREDLRRSLLPAGLGDAGQFAPVRHRAQADAAQAELPVHGSRPAAAGAPRVGADGELRLTVSLGDQRLLRHPSALLEREAKTPQQRAALSVIGCRGDDADVHSPLPVYLVWVDLVEHDLLD